VAVVAIDRGASRSLERVEVHRTRAGLANLRALAHFRAGDAAGAEAAWAEAVREDGTFGDAAYNLACLHALGGDLDLAGRELRIALSIDPQRYRWLARGDPDLAALRRDPEIRAELGLPPVQGR
jgi:Tfp pilus assembly protein PilF